MFKRIPVIFEFYNSETTTPSWQTTTNFTRTTTIKSTATSTSTSAGPTETMVPRYYIPEHFIFSCHFIPNRKMHNIPNGISFQVRFISKCTASQDHFISKGTSSHSALHLISHFILQIISSLMKFHPLRHFIPYFIPLRLG